MAIPDKIIDQIQERTDIVDVISRHVPLKKAGRNYKAPCPFHHEKTPSFIVSRDKQIYHCFGCGAGGNVFSFLMKHENMQFPEVIEMLAEKAGIALPRDISRNTETDSLSNQLYRINEAACQFFQTSLANNNSAQEYLASRGLGSETIKKLRIGYAPAVWEALLNYFKTKNTVPALLEKAGLAIANDKGGHYDRFRNRIIFPIVDLRDRIVGFGGRVLDSSLPKYMNSPETFIYSKGRGLYGLNLAKEHIKTKGHALIVEGYLDFAIPYQAGVKNIIATLGTALTLDQVKLLKRFTNTAVMAYDPDEAGEAASLRNLDLMISEDVNVYIAELPAGLDPDAYIRKFGTEDFLKLIKSSKNLFDYKLDRLAGRFDMTSTHGKTRIASEMLPTIAKINNAVLKSDLVKRLAEKLAVNEEAIREELKKVKADYAEQRYVVNESIAKRDSKSAEMIILALLLEGGRYIEKISQRLSPEEFHDSSVRDVVNMIFSFHKENSAVSPARLMNHLGNKADATNLISEAASILEILMNKDKALEDCIARMKKDIVKDRLNRLQDAIKIAHNNKDEDMVKQLVEEYNDLVKLNKA